MAQIILASHVEERDHERDTKVGRWDRRFLCESELVALATGNHRQLGRRLHLELQESEHALEAHLRDRIHARQNPEKAAAQDRRRGGGVAIELRIPLGALRSFSFKSKKKSIFSLLKIEVRMRSSPRKTCLKTPRGREEP